VGNTVIKTEHLGKKFIIGHQKPEQYTALRDVITNNAKNALRKTRQLVKGSYLPEGTIKEEFWALKDINFEISQGDRVGIIGRNGAGKSTLLKILSRISEPTEGRVSIEGRVASLLEVGTGFHPELIGRENIFLNGAILGMSRAEIKKRFDEIVAFAEVEQFLDTPVKRYSSGMYLRLAFAVAAHLEPEILIVDEVLAVGDAQFQKKCLGKMEEVSKNEGRTVLFVSHNMGTVLQLCENCILLKSGIVTDMGKSSLVIEKYYDNKAVEEYRNDNSDTDIFLKQVFPCDYNGNLQSNFAHQDDIRLRLIIGVNKFLEYQNIGVCLLRQDKKRVFTVNKSLHPFYKDGCNEITVDFIIEGGLIAPMEYSFLVALNAQTGTITYDWQEDICPIKVYDDGTNFSFAEGRDYGCIILKDKWSLVSN
jgi:lipopolysaccharide transport system ATP-binding protein